MNTDWTRLPDCLRLHSTKAPMGAKAAGSIFWAFFLVLFPVAVQLSSPGCVTYKHISICGLKGSSVVFSCFYPKKVQVISTSGWSKRLHPNMNPQPLKEMPAYSSRMKYLERKDNICTMTLTDLKDSDTSIYYFAYNFTNVTGHHMTCTGVPGVRLHILASPVSILVMKLVRGQGEPVADWTVMEGQTITLTCARTCASNLNSNRGYIWYKNRLQLNSSRENLQILSFDPVSDEDTGRYVCVMIGYKNFPSSPVSLTVQTRPRNIVISDEIPDGGSKKDSVLTVTHACDAQNSTDQIFSNCQTPRGKSMFTVSVMLTASVCVGFVIVIMAVILVLTVKRKNKKRCAGVVPGPPNPNSDFYMALDINSMSAEYDTLDTVRGCSAADTVYENLRKPAKSMG